MRCLPAVFSFLVLLANSVHADPVAGSEYFHQAAASTWEVTPQLAYQRIDADYRFDQGSATVKSTAFGVRGEYGISQMISVGIDLAVGRSTTDYYTVFNHPSAKTTGLSDPSIYLLGRYDLGSAGRIEYGAALSLSPDKSRTNSKDESNAFSGQTTFTPFVGYQFLLGRHMFGAKVAYDVVQTDAKWEDSDDHGTDKGGRELLLGGFYEFHLNSLVAFGGALELLNRAEINRDAASGTSERTSPQTQLAFRTYVPFTFTPSITLIPELDSFNYTAYDTSAVDSLHGWTAKVAGRFTF